MRRAAVDNKAFRYAEGIMRSWAKTNVKTAPDPDQQRAIQERIARLKTSQKMEVEG